MDEKLRDKLDEIHLKLSLIRDANDCPEVIIKLIDEIRYDDIFIDDDNLDLI